MHRHSWSPEDLNSLLVFYPALAAGQVFAYPVKRWMDFV